MKKCYICNAEVSSERQEVVAIYEVPKEKKDDGTFYIESFVVAWFCKECFFDSCDSKLVKFSEREHSKCLYCKNKVDMKSKHFYISWERSFDVVNSELIDGKCYNENIGIYAKRPKQPQFINSMNSIFSYNWHTSSLPLFQPSFDSGILNKMLDEEDERNKK